MTTAIYAVEEMICQSWKAAVFQGVRPVLGVTEAAVDLVAAGRSPLVLMRGTTLVAGSVHDACDPVPAHFPSTAVLGHSESTLQPAIASAGGRGF